MLFELGTTAVKTFVAFCSETLLLMWKKIRGFYVRLFPLNQDILSYHKRSQQRLPSGLYLGYLKLCSSVDQIKVLVLQKLPNVLCHVKIRDNSNVSK